MQGRIDNVETLWADFATPLRTAEDYINSLRGRRMNVFFMGERVPEPVEHPVIRPSINAMAETYRLASEHPDLATVQSGISKQRDFGVTQQILKAYGDLVKESLRQILEAICIARQDKLQIAVSGLDEFDIGEFSTELDDAKKLLALGLSLGVLLWFTLFIAIGGEWFLMWQSKNWNGQNNAFLLCICFLLFLIYLNQPDE